MKKLMSLVLLAAMLMTMAAGALAADGTFSGEGAGKGGMIKVDVTIAGGELVLSEVSGYHDMAIFKTGVTL